VAVHPIERVGQLTLKPIDLDGAKRILINADASKGAARVEILNADAYRIRGFTKDDAVPITSDSIRHVAAWKEKSLHDLPGGKFILRIHLEDASCFAVTVQ